MRSVYTNDLIRWLRWQQRWGRDVGEVMHLIWWLQDVGEVMRAYYLTYSKISLSVTVRTSYYLMYEFKPFCDAPPFLTLLFAKSDDNSD